MSIGIVTLWGTDDNYGQILQNFSLQQYLKLQGYKSTTLRYCLPSRKQKIYKRIIEKISFKIRSYTIKGKKENEEVKQWLSNLEDSKVRNFEEFRNKYLCYGPITSSSKYLEEAEFDTYIVGSDQVWNIDFNDPIAPYRFLQFAKNKRCISYAASIGKAKLSKFEIDRIQEYTNHFYSISIREKDSCDYINENSNLRCEWVLDPAFLLNKDQYIEILQLDNKKYSDIFIYALNVNEYSDIFGEEIETYCENNNLSMQICCSTGFIPYKELSLKHPLQQLSIEEWLEAILSAKKVITTSFHGVAFSLIFNKDFIYIPLGKSNSNSNNRVFSLLKYLGLESKIAMDATQLSVLLRLSDPLSKESLLCLKNMIESSKKFIKKSLS